MLTQFTPSLTKLAVMCVLGVASTASFAQTTNQPNSGDYQQQLQHCQTLSGESRAACQREAGAALSEARKNALTNADGNFDSNRTVRCAALPANLRPDCEAQMRGEYETQTFGSVEGGGVLRQTTITIPGETYQPEPTIIIPEKADPHVVLPR
ncbi:hypothetical protein L1889_04935 [Paenalcaligenes niemegkensis]|uniref:hypothetical protein n=1 Tax=Paenalcaligenes niemegkensis TaxID=2895469 RepID=UPI001EE93A22|nr:hypothetical protein [Paenalcaligenes niemegkensis]MCQ9616129.1 hypothetical protein [Paenalcaligenes niemegkensis]